MPRLLFEKTGNAVWISHLDLMRLFQRAFKRAGLPLTHTQGFNPRPSVSISLPLSVGVESRCELLDFDLDCPKMPPYTQIVSTLNDQLVDGIRVVTAYENGSKLKNLAFLDCTVTMEYDQGIPEGAQEKLHSLFSRPSLTVEKTNKNGTVEQDLIPMIRRLAIRRKDESTLCVDAFVCCQNPTLNPAQLHAAIERYMPELAADHFRCTRHEIYDTEENIFR